MSSNQCQYEVGLAINCLANIATHDLARDCLADLVQLMAHGLPYVSFTRSCVNTTFVVFRIVLLTRKTQNFSNIYAISTFNGCCHPSVYDFLMINADV